LSACYMTQHPGMNRGNQVPIQSFLSTQRPTTVPTFMIRVIVAYTIVRHIYTSSQGKIPRWIRTQKRRGGGIRCGQSANLHFMNLVWIAATWRSDGSRVGVRRHRSQPRHHPSTQNNVMEERAKQNHEKGVIAESGSDGIAPNHNITRRLETMPRRSEPNKTTKRES
jgi:hypothetical protein